MFNVEDVVSVEFKGFFQRRMDKVNALIEHRNSLKINPAVLKSFDNSLGSTDDLLPFRDRKYSFQMWGLHYDPNSGLFIARGLDRYGVSGIVGEINGEDIEFVKRYVGDIPIDINDDYSTFLLERQEGQEIRSDVVDHFGQIVKIDGKITLDGTYHIVNLSKANDGTWRLGSV